MESIDNKNYVQTLKHRHGRKKYKVTETASSFRSSFIKVQRRKSKFCRKRIVTRWTRIKKNNLSVDLVALNYVYIDMLLIHVSWTEFRIYSEFKMRKSQSWKVLFSIMTTITKTATSVVSQFVLIAFHYSFKVLCAALDHCSNHLQTDQSLNEKRIIAACNATLMKSKWPRSEEKKKVCFIFEPWQWTDRKPLHFNLVTWESISQLDTSLVIEIHHKLYAVECWASDNNDWCLHSDPKQWPNTNYKSSTQNL